MRIGGADVSARMMREKRASRLVVENTDFYLRSILFRGHLRMPSRSNSIYLFFTYILPRQRVPRAESTSDRATAKPIVSARTLIRAVMVNHEPDATSCSVAEYA